MFDTIGKVVVATAILATAYFTVAMVRATTQGRTTIFNDEYEIRKRKYTYGPENTDTDTE